MRVIVLVNAASGVRPREIRQETEHVSAGLLALGVTAEVREVPGPAIAEAARMAAAECDAVVLGGGDGTMSAGAGALAGGATPMGLLPMGTLNHFARDLGIPQDLDAALAVIAAGHVRRVDVGEANGRVFVNNTSIGLYPEAVRAREKLREESGTGKWTAMTRGALATLLDMPVPRVILHLEGGAVRVTTPMVFVGNNRYEMSLFSPGTRASLEGGELWLYVARGQTRLGVLGLALHALLGRLDQARDFLALGLSEFVIEDRRQVVRVAFDGEVCAVPSPVVYRIRPRDLPVIVPAPEAPPP